MNKYLNALLSTLQSVHDSDGDPEVVYPILEEYLNCLNKRFAEVLREWAIVTLPQLELLHAQGTAAAVFSFSDLIQQFPYGEQADHLEIAIAGYKAVKIVVTRTDFPQDWAIIQVSLGNAYANRIHGEQAENLEQAIGCYQGALEICTLDANSEQWAIIQENLGNVYADRIEGDRAENIERAIEYYTAALDVFSREAMPVRWARIHKNLGVVYLTQTEGERSDSLESALRCYLASLEIYTQENHPELWAELHNNLALVYQERIQGEDAENLESAIQSGLAALRVYTQDDYPWQWAITQNNLGSLYEHRTRGNFQQNQATAIQCYQNALKVLTKEFSPEQWSMLQNNLGSLYYNYGQDKTGENFETAIHHLTAALEVRIREAMPVRWAEIQNNLGNIYLDRIQEDKAENLERSIRYYSAALNVYTREDFPAAWADTQGNLGTVYRLRIKGDRAANLEHSIHCHLQPLEVYRSETRPQDWLTAQNNLGIVYQDAGQFQNAYLAFKASIEMVELLRGQIITGSRRDDDKQQLAERWNILYQRMVEVCLALEQVDQTIAYVERSKTRNLVELILTRDRHTIFPPEVVAQLDRFRDEIASGQYELQNATAEDPTALAQHLQQLRQQRNELQDRYLPIGSGFQFEPFRSTLSDRTAIVEFYITTDKLLVFIITKQAQQPIVLSPDLIDLNKLANWANSYLKAYSNKKSHWQRRLTTRLHLLAKILHIDEIIEQIPTECNKLILIPHRYLHLLPLHALPLAGDSSLFDGFPEGVSYAPSCQLLQLAKNRQRPEFTRLFAVQNPTGDLSYTDIEVETIQSYFSTTNLLKQKIATKEAVEDTSLNTVHCAHFSCHGYFNGTEPRKSALILANAELNSAPTQPDAENYLSLGNSDVLDLNKCLTLDSIFTLNLEQCRLVTLSACETGLIDFRNTSDEYIGLPSGFLYAGASSVVSSLWTVNDLSTAFLMIRFYQNLQKGLTVGLALNQAQLWLKDLTKGALETWIEENQLQLKPSVRMNLRRRLYKLEDDAKPFESPFYWAAFCVIGRD